MRVHTIHRHGVLVSASLEEQVERLARFSPRHPGKPGIEARAQRLPDAKGPGEAEKRKQGALRTGFATGVQADLSRSSAGASHVQPMRIRQEGTEPQASSSESGGTQLPDWAARFAATEGGRVGNLGHNDHHEQRGNGDGLWNSGCRPEIEGHEWVS